VTGSELRIGCSSKAGADIGVLPSKCRRAMGFGLQMAIAAMACLWGAISQAQGAGPESVLNVRAEKQGTVYPAFRMDLLHKALQASGHPFTLSLCQFPPGQISDLRRARMVAEGDVCDVLTTSAGADFTRQLDLVPVPIYLGGGGYRVFLAKPVGLKRAAKVRGIDDLRKLSIGSGNAWVDTKIMSDAGLQVTRAEYAHLYAMLKLDRFDLFTRSVFDVGTGLANEPKNHGLAIEPHLLLRYPSDLFFYVSPKKPLLRRALTQGLQRMAQRGELERFIREHPSTQNMPSQLRLDQRLLIELENANLSAEEALALKVYSIDWMKRQDRK